MTSPYGRAALICNGSRKAKAVKRALPEIENHLRARELEYEMHITTRSGEAIALARRAIESGITFVVAVGGDGTIHEVVNGMMNETGALAPDAVLGVVALGRGSDFVRTFGIPSLAPHAVAHLDGPESFPIDLGRVSFQADGRPVSRYFVNAAEVGLGARITARAQRLPAWLGPTVYLAALWIETLEKEKGEASVDLVDRSYTGSFDTVVVANGQFLLGGMKIAPRAAPTDGLLDILIDTTSRRERIALVPRFYRGDHLPHPDIRLAKRVKVSVGGAPRLLEADGEVLGHTPATFEVVPRALRLKV